MKRGKGLIGRFAVWAVLAIMLILSVTFLPARWRVTGAQGVEGLTGAAGMAGPAGVAGVARVAGEAAGNVAQPLVWYKIDVQLKLDEKQRPTDLEGKQQLTWLNDSPDTISELQFHLYLNAFKNKQSTFFKESGGQLRGDDFAEGEWGWIDIEEMKLAGGEDLTGKIEFIHPDDDNADDRTVIRVPLSQPVKPGEKIVLDIRFKSKLPRVFARTGYWGSFAMVAQWFPKIGVWESAGERRRAVAGWNCHQFHAHSEFYADFGVYDVNITLPESYQGKIGATGVMRSEKVNPNRTVTYNFYQENVHDFAWTVDSNYLVLKRWFRADQQVTPAELNEWSRRLNLPVEQIRLKDVEVTLVIQPEHQAQIDRHFKAAFNAIKYFGLWYGQYPYDTLTVVDPPYNGLGAGGMEYPTLITAGTSWRAGIDQNPEAVIVHEFGHQFWYGLVATNEFEESWLDEGFNTYSTSKVLQVAYGDDVLPFRMAGLTWFYFPVKLPHPYENRLMTLQGKFNDPILTPSWKYYDSMSYGLNSYPRTGLVLSTLERYLGEDVMARVMREYHRKWRYRHPASQDFFDLVNQTTGQDFNWFFDQYVKGTETLDYEIAEMNSEEVEQGEAGGKAYRSEVSIRRLGEAWFPVDLMFRFEDGSRILGLPISIHDGLVEYRFENSRNGQTWTENWPINERWKKLVLTSESEMTHAQVDPWNKALLDANLTNNSKTDNITMGAEFRWGSSALFWVQTLMQLFIAFE